MCMTKKAAAATAPSHRGSKHSSQRSTPTNPTSFQSATTSFLGATAGEYSSNLRPSTSSSTSTSLTFAGIRDALKFEKPVLYPFSDVCSATNNFLSPRISSSTSSWRCLLHNKEVVVSQRRLRGDPGAVHDRLAAICRSHHSGLVKLLGASIGDGGDSVYLVYEHVRGASLSDCLRNPKNPNFSLLPTWISRIQVAADLAGAIDYIHNYSSGGADSGRIPLPYCRVHNRIKSSSVIVTEADLRAKLCHYGTAELTGEIEQLHDDGRNNGGGKHDSVDFEKKRRRSGARMIEGTRGYIAPEVISGSSPSQKTDVFAFGVVLLELLTGEEPMRYRRERNGVVSISLIDEAREVVSGRGGEERRQRVRRWVDARLKDSFPVEVAERLAVLAVECVEKEEDRRLVMGKVAVMVSKMLLKSREWAEKIALPTEISFSMSSR